MKKEFIALTKNLARSVTRGAAPKKFGLFLAALGFSTLARADVQVPFKGNFIPMILSTTPLDATHVRLEIDVHIQATQLGHARGPAWAILDVTTLAYVGGATWAAANGDAVSFTF